MVWVSRPNSKSKALRRICQPNFEVECFFLWQLVESSCVSLELPYEIFDLCVFWGGAGARLFWKRKSTFCRLKNLSTDLITLRNKNENPIRNQRPLGKSTSRTRKSGAICVEQILSLEPRCAFLFDGVLLVGWVLCFFRPL